MREDGAEAPASTTSRCPSWSFDHDPGLDQIVGHLPGEPPPTPGAGFEGMFLAPHPPGPRKLASHLSLASNISNGC